MHRIDGEGATPDGRFTEGNPITGEIPTVVTKGWLNDVQENIMRCLREGGIPATKGRDLDLWDAIMAGATKIVTDILQSFEYVQDGGNVTGTIKGGKFRLNAAGPTIPATLTATGGNVTGSINVLAGTFTLTAAGGGSGGGEGPALPDGILAIGSGTGLRAAATGAALATWNGSQIGVANGSIGASGGDGLFVFYAGTGTGNFQTAIESSGAGPAQAGKFFLRCANSVPAPGAGGDLAFAVDMFGNVAAKNTSIAAADYAEWFETADGQAIPPGVSVVLDGGKIRPARKTDPRRAILGVTRPPDAPGVIGNAAEHQWAHAYLTDDFGQPVLQETILENTDAKTGSVTRTPARVPKHNPDYDPARPYVPRSQRPEWALVGLLGQVPVRPGQPIGDRWFELARGDTVNTYFVR